LQSFRLAPVPQVKTAFFLAVGGHAQMENTMSSKQPSHSHDAVPAILFDLDGTLIDSVYQHVLAWPEAWNALERGCPFGAFIDASE